MREAHGCDSLERRSDSCGYGSNIKCVSSISLGFGEQEIDLVLLDLKAFDIAHPVERYPRLNPPHTLCEFHFEVGCSQVTEIEERPWVSEELNLTPPHKLREGCFRKFKSGRRDVLFNHGRTEFAHRTIFILVGMNWTYEVLSDIQKGERRGGRSGQSPE